MPYAALPTSAQRLDVLTTLALVAARSVPGDDDDQAAEVTVRRARLYDLHDGRHATPMLTRTAFARVLAGLAATLTTSRAGQPLRLHTGHASTDLVTLHRDGSWSLDGSPVDRDALVADLDTTAPLDDALALPYVDEDWGDGWEDEDAEPEDDRTCTRCSRLLPATKFAPRARDDLSRGRRARCRECDNTVRTEVRRTRPRFPSVLPRDPAEVAAEDARLDALPPDPEPPARPMWWDEPGPRQPEPTAGIPVPRQAPEAEPHPLAVARAQRRAEVAEADARTRDRARPCCTCRGWFLAEYTDLDADPATLQCPRCQARAETAERQAEARLSPRQRADRAIARQLAEGTARRAAAAVARAVPA